MGNDAGEPGNFKGIPYNLQKLVKAVGFPTFEDLEEDEARIYDLVRHGRCMTCERPLGAHVNFIITKHGIVGGYCSGVCNSDMAILGFLQEQHHDITEKVEFRKARIPQEDVEDGKNDDEGSEEL